MTDTELLTQIAATLMEIQDLLCLLLAFSIFRTFERGASKKGLL